MVDPFSLPASRHALPDRADYADAFARPLERLWQAMVEVDIEPAVHRR